MPLAPRPLAKPSNLLSLGLLLGLSAVVAGVSSIVTVRNVDVWYAALDKPPFNPPNAVFGPVWTVLYIAMAVAAWRVWRKPSRGSGNRPMRLYLAQMVFNFAWSILFFGLHQIGAALIDIAILLLLLTPTTISFWKRDRLAGALMAPYLAWVAFATALTFAIWRFN